MDTRLIAMICAGIALMLTPVYLFLLVKGVRTLSDLRELLRGPVRGRVGKDA